MTTTSMQRSVQCAAFAGFFAYWRIHMVNLDQPMLSPMTLLNQFILFGTESFCDCQPHKRTPFTKACRVSIPLSPSGDITCPVNVLRTLVELYPQPATAPLFSQLIGPFDRKWVLGELRQALLFAGINLAG